MKNLNISFRIYFHRPNIGLAVDELTSYLDNVKRYYQLRIFLLVLLRILHTLLGLEDPSIYLSLSNNIFSDPLST